MYPLFPGKHVGHGYHEVPRFSLFPGKHVVGHACMGCHAVFVVGSVYDGVPWLLSLFHRKRVDGSGYHRSTLCC